MPVTCSLNSESSAVFMNAPELFDVAIVKVLTVERSTPGDESA